MANPQVENGYTSIANELLEAIIRSPMSDYEHRIFWLIIRKTYGFKKKEDWISQKQIMIETGILKQNVYRSVNKLLEKNMIIKDVNKLSIQKDYDLWKIDKSNLNRLLEKVISTDYKVISIDTKVISTDYKSNLNRGTQKKKEKIQKKDSSIIRQCKEIIEAYNFYCPSLNKTIGLGPKRIKNLESLLKDFDFEKIVEVFQRVEKSDFLTLRVKPEGYTFKGANFNWIIDVDHFIKINDGEYDNKKYGNKEKKSTQEDEAQQERLKQFKEGKLKIDDRPIIAT